LSNEKIQNIRSELETASKKNAKSANDLKLEIEKVRERLDAIPTDFDKKLASLDEELTKSIQNQNKSINESLEKQIQETNKLADAKFSKLEKNSTSQFQNLDAKHELIIKELNSFDWTSFLLITLSTVLVVKIILSQGEIKNLTSQLDLVSGKVSDDQTWQKIISNLEQIVFSSKAQTTQSSQITTGKDEKNHSLQLAVFGEIERLEARLAKYDESDKNRKPMMKALERLEEKLSEIDYEREKLVGGKYIEGKNYEARFIPSKDPKHQTPTITRVYKPSIFHNGKLIQRGEVEVSEFKE
ncbi:MAG: hypothetical protein HOI70_00575, partial [Opitutae bacterium]|nr:hypothetical protein [Opitutae bacterium]